MMLATQICRTFFPSSVVLWDTLPALDLSSIRLTVRLIWGPWGWTESPPWTALTETLSPDIDTRSPELIASSSCRLRLVA
ncbi:hypothetical protein D3C80_1859790 [compost metagenome]